MYQRGEHEQVDNIDNSFPINVNEIGKIGVIRMLGWTDAGHKPNQKEYKVIKGAVNVQNLLTLFTPESPNRFLLPPSPIYFEQFETLTGLI